MKALTCSCRTGSGKQWTLRENQRTWDDYVFTPNRMNGIIRDKIDLSVTLFGETLPHPIIVTPFGSHSLHHPAGEVASASTVSMEDIVKASQGPKWFQIYLDVDEGISRELLQRAKAAGFKAIMLTVDSIGQGSSDQYEALGKPRPRWS